MTWQATWWGCRCPTPSSWTARHQTGPPRSTRSGCSRAFTSSRRTRSWGLARTRSMPLCGSSLGARTRTGSMRYPLLHLSACVALLRAAVWFLPLVHSLYANRKLRGNCASAITKGKLLPKHKFPLVIFGVTPQPLSYNRKGKIRSKPQESITSAFLVLQRL